MPSNGSSVTVFLSAVATQTFVPVRYQWTEVTPGIDNFASTTPAAFSATNTTSPGIQLTLAKSGTYQIKVQATSADNHTVTSYAWINAWDPVPAAGINAIGRNPGILPPPSVRTLSADPGPFNHPRILFSSGDWANLTAKTSGSTAVPETVAAISILQTSLAKNFDLAGTPMNNLGVALTKYAADGYAAADYTAIANTNGFSATNVPALFSSTLMGNYTNSSFSDALAAASYLAWLAVDPTKPLDTSTAPVQRLQQLGMLTAAWSNFLLQAELANPVAFTGAKSNVLANYSLALAYDLTYAAMTSTQQATARTYLYTIGNLYNTGGGGIGLTKPAINPSSLNQNGVDFPNLQDGIIFPALAIEGEESSVASSVLSNALFGSYVPASGSTDPAVTPVTSWPNANQTTVRNMGRQVRANSEFELTPWGFYHDMTSYFQLGQNVSAPTILALARRGENQWVTTNLYQASLQQLYNLVPREAGGTMGLLDHHDSSGFSGGDGQRNSYYVAKFMYPDDPMIDFVYQQATNGWTSNALTRAMLGTPLLNNSLAQVAAAKQLALTKFDPFTGFLISRNSWNENDLSLVMNNFSLGNGHYHAEANSFKLSALGRAWANPPGYHVTIGDDQQQVLIETHPGATDASEGYTGQGPGSYDKAANNGIGGPFHGVYVDIEEDPNQLWTWFAGDAGPAYNYVNGGTSAAPVSTGLPASYFFIPGIFSATTAADTAQLGATTQFATGVPYNPVSYAYRSIMTIRGATPYVLVIDDIEKDGSAHNYRWTMNDSVGFGGSGGVYVDANNNSEYSSLQIEPGSTATDAILYHTIDSGTAAGLPRLLVRDVTQQSTSGQPSIVIEDRPIVNGLTPTYASNLTYGVDNNSGQVTFIPSRRLFIDRRNVATPQYKVLLFPFASGASLPTTSWDATKSVLTVQVGSQIDTISFDYSNSDHRTRLKSFTRTTN